MLGERDPSMRMRAWFGSISGRDREQLFGRTDVVALPDPLPFEQTSASSLRRALFFDQTSWLPDNLLERGDRMMMAGSIEGRMPFMDVELASMAARIPDRFLAGLRSGKRVLRAALRNVLPREILQRRKVGFRVPFHDWFRNRYRDMLRDTLSSEASQVARLCDRSALDRYLREHLEGRNNHERILWTLVNLELFFREFRPEGVDAEEREPARHRFP
jgi:asparagine synthase (glutamine-hydrolysing)